MLAAATLLLALATASAATTTRPTTLPSDELLPPNGCDKKGLGGFVWHDAAALGLRGKAFNATDEV